MPTESFIRGIVANLGYWQKLSNHLDDNQIRILDTDRQNIYRAVQIGLSFGHTASAATTLAMSLFEFIEWRGYWLEWIPILEQALALEATTAKTRCKLLNQVGFLYYLSQQVPKAIDIYQEAGEVAELSGNSYELAYAHYGLSVAHHAIHKYDEAEKYGSQALNEFTALQADLRMIAGVLNILGMISHAQGDYLIAEKHLFQVVEMRLEIARPTELVQALNNLAITFRAQKKYETALKCFTEALAYLDRSASKLTEINTLNSLGHLYFEMGRLTEAEAAFRQMDVAYLLRAGHIGLMALRANNLGNTLLEQTQLQAAESHFREAVDLWRQTNDKLNLANTLGDLAQTLAKQGRHREAAFVYEEAIDLLRDFPENAWARDRFERLLAHRLKL